MQTHLISKEFDNVLFLDVIIEDFREQSKLISILISSLTQQSPLLEIYEEKKKLLLDNLNSQRLNGLDISSKIDGKSHGSFKKLRNITQNYFQPQTCRQRSCE
jgi:hypothetical protein